MSPFAADVYQNEYLPPDGSEVHAIVTVTAAGLGGSNRPGAAEILIVDSSGSMGEPVTKIRAAREATAVAIDCIRDGVVFAVIEGTDTARPIYPDDGVLVPANEKTRKLAKETVRWWVKPGGGTAIGSWLELARQLFAEAPAGIRHAILLTDGEDRDETPEQLDGVLASCAGVFQCDCRGVGADWIVSELRRVASALLGTVDIIADPADMAADFRSMMERAMTRAAKVSLRLWTPQSATLAFVRQVAPAIEDLTDHAVPLDARTLELPTGAWGDESRDYHVCVRVQPHEVGEEMLAARVGLVVDDEVVSQALVRAIWTDDERLSTRINREVAHYTGQAELAGSIQAGLEARKAGDVAEAARQLGRAAQLAAEGGNDGTMKLLERVVEVEDAASGTVRLREDVADLDEMTLDTRSTRTVRVHAELR